MTGEPTGRTHPSGGGHAVVPVFLLSDSTGISAGPIRGLADRCFGLTTTVARLSRVSPSGHDLRRGRTTPSLPG